MKYIINTIIGFLAMALFMSPFLLFVHFFGAGVSFALVPISYIVFIAYIVGREIRDIRL